MHLTVPGDYGSERLVFSLYQATYVTLVSSRLPLQLTFRRLELSFGTTPVTAAAAVSLRRKTIKGNLQRQSMPARNKCA